MKASVFSESNEFLVQSMTARSLTPQGPWLAAALAGLLALASVAKAANIEKANNTNALNVAASWVQNVVPGFADTAIWDSNDGLGTSNDLGAALTWSQLEILNPGGPVTIGADSNTLTLSNGINMLQAQQSMTLDNNILVAAPQTWSIGSNQTLTVNGLLTRNSGAEILFHFDNSAAQVVVTPSTATGSLATALNAVMEIGNLPIGTSNDVDFASLSGTGQVVGGASLGIYTGNPATGSTPNLAAGPTVVYDFNSPSNTGGYNGCRISTTTYIEGMRFNTPQTNTVAANAPALYNGVPNWYVTFKAGNVMDLNVLLVTTNVGNSPIVFGPGGNLRMYEDNSANAINEFVVLQNNPAASVILQSPLYERTVGNGGVLSKIGVGTLELQATAGNSGEGWSGSTLIYGGTIFIDGAGTVGSAPLTVFSGANFQGQTGASNVASVTVNNGGTNSIYVASANSQFWQETNLTFNAGTTWLQFLYSNTIAPSATIAPLLITNATASHAVLSASNTVNININCGNLAVGQFPLIRYATTPNLGTNTFAGVFNLVGLEPHVTAFLSNNVASNSVDLVVTSVNQPIHWAVGNGTWDIGVSSNWVDSLGNKTTFQQLGILGDNVLLNDATSGVSPGIALNSAVFPSSVIVSSSTNNYSITGTGGIYGLASFTKSGSSTLTLATSNGFTGGLTLNGGTLNFSALNNLGTGPLNFNGGTLQYAAGNTADVSALTTVFAAGGATIDTDGNAVTLANPIGTGNAGSLTKVGTGLLTLNGTNTYTGATIVSAGTLLLGTNAAVPNTPSILVSVGAVFDAGAISNGAVVTNFVVGAITSQTLTGTGTVRGEIATGGQAIISPAGNGVYGTLSFSNDLIVSNASGILAMDVSPTNNDVISIAGNLTLLGGILQLNVASTMPFGTYTLIKYGGTLESGAGSSANLTVAGFAQQGAVAVLSDATPHQINLVVQAANNFPEVWTGSVSASWDVGLTSNWLLNATSAVFENGDLANFNDTAQQNTSINLMAALQPGSVTVSVTNNVYSFNDGTGTGGGKISGTGSLSMNGPQTLTVLTANNNSGGAFISAASTVNVGNGSVTGDLGTGNITNNGTLIYNQPDNRFVPGIISGTGTLTKYANGTLTLASNNTYKGGTSISTGTLQIGQGGAGGSIGTGPITNNAALVFDISSSLNLSNAITGGGTLTTEGSGTILLTGSNSYTGTTYIEGGTLELGSAIALPPGAIVELDGQAGPAPAGTFDLHGYNVLISGLAGTYGTTNGTIANNAATGTNTLTITNGAADTYAGRIVDSTTTNGKTAIFIANGATQTFDIETATGNTYSGGTIISNGTLTLSSANGGNYGANSVGLGSGPVTLYGGTLNLAGSGAQSTSDTYAPALSNIVIVPPSWAGTVAGASRGESFAPVQLQGGGAFTFLTTYVRGTIGGNWSTFTGQVYWQGTATGGNLGLATTNAFYKVFCSSAGGGAVTLYNTLAGTPTISFGELADDGTTSIESTSSGNAGGAAANFSVGGANTSTNFGGYIGSPGGVPAAAPGDNLSITKVGTGVWGLTNSSATAYLYTGATTVGGGILAFSNQIPAYSTPITVTAPGILDASGAGGLLVGGTTNQTIQGNGTVNGYLFLEPLGNMLPGAGAIGTLTTTTTNELAGAVTMKLNITNGVQTNDVLAASTLKVDSTATLTITNVGPPLITGDTFKLFQAGQIINNGGFASITLPPSPGNGITYVWNTNNLLTTGTITLVQGATNLNLTPTNLSYSVSASHLSISWPTNQTGWYLESQTNPPNVGITTNWAVVSGSNLTNALNFTISTTNTVFYRLLFTTNNPP